MMRLPTIPFVLLAVWALVPAWSGDERLLLLGQDADIKVKRVVLERSHPARVRVGRLRFLGGISLTSTDPAFGGFSSLQVVGDRFTLLSDGGNIVRFQLGRDWQPQSVTFANLPGGPGTGWNKRDRDSESLTRDPATGQNWVGFERANAIWRYSADLARVERWVRPPSIRQWRENGGPETLLRLHDGQFLTIAEVARPGQDEALRDGIMFSGDPALAPRAGYRFFYKPTQGFRPVDATELPDGTLLIVERRFSLPYQFSTRLLTIRPGAVQPGRIVAGQSIAALNAPLIHDNFEGVAAVREGSKTIIWVVSDDNRSFLQRSLLLKFGLEDHAKT